MSLRYSGVIAGAALALYAAASSAQPAPPPEPGQRMERHERAERQERTVIIRRGDDMGADRAEHLRAILQLKPGQDAALNAYLEAMRPTGGHERMMRMHGEGRAKSTPERLAQMEARMAEHEAAMRSKIAATKRFYDQLDPAQKRAFDELPLMMGGPMPMMGGMKIMHRGGPHVEFPPDHFQPPEPPRPPAPPRS
jgi:hypothetical protein